MATQTRINSKRSLPVSKLVFCLIILALVAFGGYYFYKYQKLKDDFANQSMSVEDKKKIYTEEVAKLYNIPSPDKEQPTIAVIGKETNLDEIKKINKFYENAQEGDVLLAYKDANMSILYRPSEKKIIKTSDYSTALALEQAKVAIIAPAAKQEEIVKSISQFTNIAVISKTEPATVISKGIVVDVSGKEVDAANTLAKSLGYEVGQLPSGEKAPEGAKLIIIAPSINP